MKKIEEPKALQEIHEIRRRIYEETKDMTSEERIAFTKKNSEEFEEMSGIKLRRLSKMMK